LSPGRAQGFEAGILNPALFGTTHTCSHLALGSRIISSHDVMGVEVRRSEVQSIRLDWGEDQTETHMRTCPE
jgi:hypothetical protein